MKALSPTTGRTREPLASLLARVVADESELAATTRAYEWRVPGSPLQSIKRLFAEQGRQLEWWVGEIARRAGAIGVALKPSPVAATATSREARAESSALTAIATRHEAVAAELRLIVEDLRWRDPDGEAVLLLEGLLEFHETSAWMLRVLLNSPEHSRMA